MPTAMQKLAEHYKNTNALIITPERLLEVINEYIKLERQQIEAAYDSGKYYPYNDCDGNKYYFINYITND